jgi:hypothetical protein
MNSEVADKNRRVSASHLAQCFMGRFLHVELLTFLHVDAPFFRILNSSCTGTNRCRRHISRLVPHARDVVYVPAGSRLIVSVRHIAVFVDLFAAICIQFHLSLSLFSVWTQILVGHICCDIWVPYLKLVHLTGRWICFRFTFFTQICYGAMVLRKVRNTSTHRVQEETTWVELTCTPLFRYLIAILLLDFHLQSMHG